jgi:alpha-glucuronidase
MRFVFARLALLAALLLPAAARAEDGYDLWLRYRPVEAPARAAYQAHAAELVAAGDSPTLRAARDELERGLSGMLGAEAPLAGAVDRPGAILIGTAANSQIAALDLPLKDLGPEGYLVRSVQVAGRPATVIAANSDVGALYGAFRLLRLIQMRQPLDHLAIADRPALRLRMLDHWDNLDRTVERGYAGPSIWDWWKLPGYVDPRYVDYARANASVGINGAVLNNVNAQPESLTGPYLEKAAAIADVLRPFGIKVYLSIRFAAPKESGGLPTADPLDPAVRAWWKAKADEVYRVIPDFGGFLVKANSEGQPGPQDYGRTHADGANMLAAALQPHGGVVIWRAFVYSNEQPQDRVKQAYSEFTPLDGQFAPNVMLQVKNGPLDFQPREPFHPLFGAMPKTPTMLEVQVTKEYLGFATHLVYLGRLWEEVLKADTHRPATGSTVARLLVRGTGPDAPTGMAGVANIGSDRNWTGSHFDQANWYAFGRLAWDPNQSSRAIAEDWARLTFSNDPAFVGPAAEMMLRSREAAVDYMTPLGLHHIMGEHHHYGPGPWVAGGKRADWTAVYYHRADAAGIGFDRTDEGSNAVGQYAEQAGNELLDDERYLLWFHHVPWDHRMRSGRTLWDELVVRYSRGVDEVRQMRRTWEAMTPYVDPDRHADVAAFLAIQEREAQWWRDACIAYFQSKSGRPLPAGYAPPAHPLAWYEAQQFPYAPGG